MATPSDVQNALIARGFDVGPDGADGDIGRNTLNAMMRALERIPLVTFPSETPDKLDDPAWLAIARKYLGVKEIKGPHHNPHIVEWWKDIGAPFKDDETPWCGAFVGGVLVEAGIKPVSGGAAARAWLKLPVELSKPAYGCVVVFWRGTKTGTAGHVGFVVGRDKFGNLMVLGGNQSDAVNIKPFAMSGPNDRVLGYRWPGVYPYADRFNLPLLGSDGKLSTDEA